MDLLTLGLWEVVGTPVEAFMGEKHEMVITYGLDDRVVGINRPPTAVAQGQPVAQKTKPNTAATPARAPPVATAQASPTTPWETAARWHDDRTSQGPVGRTIRSF